MDTSDTDQTVQHLWNIGQQIASSCPAASRYYMFSLKKYLLRKPTLQTKEIKSHTFCEHCGSLWSAENHKVRIQPAPSKNSHIKKLLKWEADEPWKLNNRQKKKLKKFKEATNKIVYTCFSCKKTVKLPGLKRKVQDSTRTSLYSLTSSIKRKRNDLNAGLYISTHSPMQQKKKISKEKEINPGHSSENLNSKSECDTKIPISEKSNLTPEPTPRSFYSKGSSTKCKQYSKNVVSEPNNSKISSSKKKNKSLLSLILKQENEVKKKTSLTAFLVSI